MSVAKVLVHCAAGVSRSTTAVVAYLMKTEGLDVEAALRQVRAKRPFVDPNEGFMAQLALYKEMGCGIDQQRAAYK